MFLLTTWHVLVVMRKRNCWSIKKLNSCWWRIHLHKWYSKYLILERRYIPCETKDSITTGAKEYIGTSLKETKIFLAVWNKQTDYILVGILINAWGRIEMVKRYVERSSITLWLPGNSFTIAANFKVKINEIDNCEVTAIKRKNVYNLYRADRWSRFS